MDGKLIPSARAFLAQLHSSDRPDNPEIVGFVATIIHFGAASKSGLPRMREHRTVVLPPYQGLGIGTRLSDAIAHSHLLEGYEYYSKTAHPRFGQYRNHSPLWVPTGANGQLQTEHTDYKDKRVKSRSQYGGVSHQYAAAPGSSSPLGYTAGGADDHHELLGSPTATRHKRPWVAKVYACHKYVGITSDEARRYFDTRVLVVD